MRRLRCRRTTGPETNSKLDHRRQDNGPASGVSPHPPGWNARSPLLGSNRPSGSESVSGWLGAAISPHSGAPRGCPFCATECRLSGAPQSLGELGATHEPDASGVAARRTHVLFERRNKSIPPFDREGGATRRARWGESSPPPASQERPFPCKGRYGESLRRHGFTLALAPKRASHYFPPRDR
jgi:hypothetical protein